MRNLIAASFLMLSCAALASCESPPDPPEALNSRPAYISADGGGIGDTRANFDDRRGKGEPLGESQVVYQNAYILTTFVEDGDYDLAEGRAQNILIQFESTNTPSVNKDRAMEAAESFLPLDAVKEIEEQGDDGFYHIQYSSESLSEVLSPGWFFESEPGDVTVSLWQREDDPSQVFAITIGTGGIVD